MTDDDKEYLKVCRVKIRAEKVIWLTAEKGEGRSRQLNKEVFIKS